jgi:very-short-patch-repair endonuclease
MRVLYKETAMRMRSDIPLSSMSRARAVRCEPTDAERKLWYTLRDRRMQALKFRRRAPVGPYSVDFLNGLTREGYAILRFSNRDILTARESVLATIAASCGLPW